MKNNLKKLFPIVAFLIVFASCKKTDYSMGDLNAPTDLQVTAEVVGQDGTHPYGDGTGAVKLTVTGKNALSYKADFDANNGVNLVFLPKGALTNFYTNQDPQTFTITVVAYGAGATSTTASTQVTVKSDFAPSADIITDLTNDASKTWRVDEDVAGHFGVGPWDPTVITPAWWAAAPHEKAACCPCFYSAHFTFNKVGTNQYSIDVDSPDGAFTKTGNLTTLPGIPSSGAEACYSYAGGSGDFSFALPTSGVAAGTSTGVAIKLASPDTYIGYGSLLTEYEIMELTPTYMYLRVQGTETGNAWYLKLEPL